MSLWNTLKSRGCHTILNDLVMLYGNHAGRLLSQILYWHTPSTKGESRLRFKRDNFFWAAFSAVEWREQTGLTEWQFRQALKILEDKKIIIRSCYHRDHLRCTCIRLIQDILEEELINEDIKEANGDSINLQNDVASTCSLNTIEIKKEIKTTAPKIGAIPTPPMDSYENLVGETKMKLSEILENRKQELRTYEIKKPEELKVGNIARAWEDKESERSGGFCKLTAKDVGMLGHLLRGLRKQFGEKEGAILALKVIDYCVFTWDDFAKRAYKNLGKKGEPPKTPQIWLVLEGQASAIQLMQQEIVHSSAHVPITEVEIPCTISSKSKLTPEEIREQQEYAKSL